MFKGFNSFNLFALQLPKVDLTRGDTAYGMESQETTSASGDIASTGYDASTGLDHISDDHVYTMVCMCVLCVGVQCNILQRSCKEAIDWPTVLFVLYSTVSAHQTINLPENASRNNAILPKSIYIYCLFRTTSQCLSSCGWCNHRTILRILFDNLVSMLVNFISGKISLCGTAHQL